MGILPAALSYLAYMVPFFLTIIYLIFGSEFILFVWIDEVLIFLITHWVSNITPLIHISSLFMFLLYVMSDKGTDDNWDIFYYIMIVFEAMIGYFYTERTMLSSGDANLHLNPQWDFIPKGAKLYPTILYLFRIKDRKMGGSGVDPDQEK